MSRPSDPNKSTAAPPIVRSAIAVSAGVFLGGVAIFGIEAMGRILIPQGGAGVPVAGANPAMPAWTLGTALSVLLAYALGPTIGAWFAARMAPSRPLVHAGLVGGVFLFGGVTNFVRFPHPGWFVAISLLCFAAAPFLGTKLAGR